MWLKLVITTFYVYKEKLLHNFSKTLKKCFASIDSTTV